MIVKRIASVANIIGFHKHVGMQSRVDMHNYSNLQNQIEVFITNIRVLHSWVFDKLFLLTTVFWISPTFVPSSNVDVKSRVCDNPNLACNVHVIFMIPLC